MIKLIDEIIIELSDTGNYRMLETFIAHGTKTVADHCRDVAIMSVTITEKLNMTIDHRRLIIAALLHDYYLYDWHVKDENHNLHGFFHGKKASDNALRDYKVDREIQNAIKRHMFPLTPIPPTTKIGIVVTLADKICATKETLRISK
ncbi:MAG: HD domain-containing protein [Erysipelotrichaceae bacterium]|nr:HD domain-containing protein [Erysipelotrichaceae bacterium]MDD3810485.1 HD domain-containing protein [Erysipelotrichaceae bacterium]